MDPATLAQLRQLTTSAAHEAESGKVDGFFENHLAFRRIVWKVSGNKYLQQTLERLVIPLFALFLIRGGGNRQGLLKTARDCVTHQEMILAAFEIQDVAQVKRVVRQFLVSMKQNLGSNLLPVVDGVGVAAAQSPR
jgi:DNA-binding GntR family transcriptional regulator